MGLPEHAFVLQASDRTSCVLDEQADAPEMIRRVEVRTPPPHVLEHSPKLLQSESTQVFESVGVGQGPLLHV
jgi:hypothetical protein